MNKSAGVIIGLRNASRLLGLIFASLLLCVPLFSQGASGRIVGTITDQTGGAIAGATVTILDVARGTSRTLTTDEAGAYSAPNLIPGAYSVRAEFKGFQTTERKNITLEVAQELRVDLTLQPGEQAQTITVTEEIPLVETTNAELGGTIENKVINDLPLNGRNFENLINLRPGITKYVGNSAWTQSSNGLRPHDNVYLVDGTNSTDPWMAQSMMNAVMAAGDAGTMLPIDAIDEFKTMENPRAEYGWKPGSIVNVGIKSGTNAIHGSAYAYGRTTGFDARDYFNDTPATDLPQCSPDPTPCTKAPVELEQWGGSMGGAIKKDKLFYFGNFETQNYSVANPITHTMPITSTSSTAIATNFKGNPASLVGACLAAGAGLTPLSAELAGLSNLTSKTPCTPLSNYPGVFYLPGIPASTTSVSQDTSLLSTSKIYAGVGKIDYHINDKNSLSGMYFRSPGDGTFVDDPTNEVSPQWTTVQDAVSQVISVGETYAPNSSWVNLFRFGYSHYTQTYTTPDANDNPADYSYNGATYNFYTGQTNPAYFGFPRTRIKQFGGYELGLAWPKSVGPDSVWQFTDSVSYLRGKHSFKFGGEVLLNQSTNNVANNTKGSFKFANLTAFFTGSLDQATIATGNYLRHMGNQGYAVFAQDDWRITPRLTVNLGLRYELSTVIKEANNLIGNFDPTVGLEQVGKQIPSLYNGDHNNFSPRLGFAWDVTGDGKTVVRGGGSIMYEQLSYDLMMAYNNLWGLKTIPTGANLYANGALLGTAGGTINNSAVLLGPGQFGSSSTVGSMDYNWANNSSSTPLYNFSSAACGDGTPVPGVATTPQPCSVLGVDRNMRTPYVTAWSLGIQHAFTANLSLDVNYVGNHGTKFLGLIDMNQPTLVGGFSPGWGNPTAGAGTGSAATGSPAYVCINDQVTNGPYGNCSPNGAAEVAAQPLVSKYPYLGNIFWLSNNNFSNYNALQVALTERTSHGLSFVAGYTYSHALGQTPDNWNQPTPTNSYNVRALYATTQFDMTHVFTFSTTYAIPDINAPGQLLKGWSLNSIVTLESATPWGVNDWTTDFSGTGEINNLAGVPGGSNAQGEQWNFYGNPIDFRTTESLANTNGGWQNGGGGLPFFPGGVSPSSPTSNAMCNAKAAALGPLAVASLYDLGCYASLNGKSVLIPAAYGSYGNTAPYMFRGAPYYNVDFSVTKVFKVSERFSAQFRAEFFNIFNHPNMSNPYGGPGGSNSFTDPSAAEGASFGFQPATSDVVNSNPVLGSGGPRAIQLGLKLLF